MIALAWCLSAAAAPTLQELEVTPSGVRTSYDVTVFVRADGNLFVEDELVLESDVVARVEALAQTRGIGARVVVSADPQADYARVVKVLDLVQQATVARVALEVGDAVPAEDPLSPLGSDAENLDESLYSGELARPRRWKYPQNPYQSTDFTAYTREWGEAKLGVASISYGVLPRIQLATSPTLDVLGAGNISAKGNFLRIGPYDAALTASYSLVPVTDLLRALDPKGRYKIAGYQLNNQQLFVREMSFVTFALQNSVQLYKGWSVHGGVGYSRATAVGNIDINNLPTIVLPGFPAIDTNDVTVVPRIVGEAFDVRFATDYRFNRRDSIIFQYAATVYGAVRGSIVGDVAGFELQGQDLKNFQLALAYQSGIPMGESYRTSLSWQFSWERVDLRFGVGLSAIPRSWLLQAFDLSYRFGGSTRKVEAAVRKQYRRDLQHYQFDDPAPSPDSDEGADEIEDEPPPDLDDTGSGEDDTGSGEDEPPPELDDTGSGGDEPLPDLDDPGLLDDEGR